VADDAVTVVRAAGGVVWRADDPTEILVVHRPKYDDWSLPKGKLDHGEHPLGAAVREVFEETGVQATPQVRLPSVRYLTGQPGVEKTVDYWSMRVAVAGGHDPTDEVDDVRWVPLAATRDLLTYAHDRGVVSAYAALPTVIGVVALVRHALAGSRKDWPGPDDERPLDDNGRRDAAHAAEVLAHLRPGRIISAPARRCVETVQPIAELIGAAVELDDRFAEQASPDHADAAIRAIAATVPATIVCSQGGLIRPLLARLRGGREPETPKGAAWVLSFMTGGGLVAADLLDLRVDPSG
jgi:8-oxo-(d)GTP phosphatase